MPVRKRCQLGRGAELVEFALVMPFVVMLLVGIADFGQAFALRQKMTNAAREGARITVSEPLTDQSCASATPCSIVAAASAAVEYMDDAGASFSCIDPSSPTTSATLEWTYTCTNGSSLEIDRGATITASDGSLLPATQVTLVYPINWWLLGYLPGLGNYTTISTQVTMANLVN